MRLVLSELVEHGADLLTYCNFKDSEGRLLLDGTNNACERAIGWCGRIQYRQMRGAKSRRTHDALSGPRGHRGSGRLGSRLGGSFTALDRGGRNALSGR